MANIKSAKKRIVIEEERREANAARKSEIKTQVKKLKAEIDAKNAENAKKEYVATCSILDKAVSDGIIHKNSADRRKATYAKLIAQL